MTCISGSFYDFPGLRALIRRNPKNIKAPTLVMQVKTSKKRLPLIAMKTACCFRPWIGDAQRVPDPDSKYMTGFASMHDIHADCPKQFAEAVVKFKEQVEAGTFEVGQ